jgi:4-aminobutyrate aminotransferase-like enzyme
MTTTTGEIAAFMAEPILGVGGFIVPPPGLL